MALKLATDIGPEDILDVIYAHVAPLLTDAAVPEALRLEVEIIYRTTRGREVIPVQDLTRFVEAARLGGGEIAYSNSLLTASAACRITARYKEGLAFVSQAFGHATSHKRGPRLSHVLVAELRLHVAHGDYDRAESTLRRMMECSISPDDTFAQNELQFYKTRIALEKGDFAGASAAFSSVQELPRSYSARRRAHSLALGVHIRLKQNASHEAIRTLISGLEFEHLKIRGLGDQDFEAYALYIGLRWLGETVRAVSLLSEYVQVHRRSEWPLPDPIRRAVQGSARAFRNVEKDDKAGAESRKTPTPEARRATA
jgi:pentatricopeptide repeat protein